MSAGPADVSARVLMKVKLESKDIRRIVVRGTNWVGDAVMTRNMHPRGHTRLPRYARGKRGVIHLIHGPQTFPDTNAHGLGEQPQVLYNVRFEGRELWGESSEPRQAVYLDLWESYFEPARP